jgi:hypothetical protein
MPPLHITAMKIQKGPKLKIEFIGKPVKKKKTFWVRLKEWFRKSFWDR